jgi:uncharacterized protein YcbK (DUF882 family)
MSSPFHKTREKRLFAVVAMLLIAPTLAQEPPGGDRRLSFFHTHTAETMDVTYFKDGAYVTSALDDLNHFLRDFRTGDAAEMDPAVFDILHEIQRQSGSAGTFEVISAYRSPATNEMLRGKSSGSICLARQLTFA